MKEFEYSKQAQLDELEDRKVELSKLSVENVTISDIESGIYSQSEKIMNIDAAITAHSDASNVEYKRYIQAQKAATLLEVQKAAYPKAVRYVELLKELDELLDSIEGGGGFFITDHFKFSYSSFKFNNINTFHKAIRYGFYGSELTLVNLTIRIRFSSCCKI